MVPHAIRHRLACNVPLLGKVTSAFLATVLAFYDNPAQPPDPRGLLGGSYVVEG